MNKYKDYYEAVAYIESLTNLPKLNYSLDRSNPEIFLKRMRFFLNLLGNPDKGLNFIHIAGTSGKGTVTNMIHGVILSSGQKVGSFTSPFVTTTIEKIKVDDKYISTKDFTKIVKYLKPYIGETYKSSPYGGVSYFEVCLAIALLYFKMNHCAWVVLEVGLGGRYDATNVIEEPIVTAITNIDYDHTELLGKTLKKIALDKAGIIKSKSEFFTSERRASILKLFKQVCLNKKIKMTQVPTSSDYMDNNKSLVRAITKHINIDNVYIEEGIKNSFLQSRFETVQENPRVIIDVAHNRAKIASTINNFKKLNFNKLHIIVAISKNKDHLAILKQLVPNADHLYFTKFKNKFRECADPKYLFELSKKYFKKTAKTKIYEECISALNLAKSRANENDLILITGSFFLAGEMRKHWYSEEHILKNRKAFN